MASETPRTVNGFLVFVGSAAALVGVTLVAVGILALNRPSGPTLENKRAQQRLDVAAKLEKEAQEKLNTAGWVDKAKGIVHAPIAEVFPIVTAELRAKKPAPSQVKIDPTLPMPVIDPKATEPPPPALTSSPQGADTIRFTAPSAPEAVPAAPAPAAPEAVPAAPAAPAPAAPPAPEKLTPQPFTPLSPAAPAPAPVAPVPAAPPAPEPPAPVPAPAKPAPAPAPASPEAPAQPSSTNPTENSESTK
jgi:hypothetical protein